MAGQKLADIGDNFTTVYDFPRLKQPRKKYYRLTHQEKNEVNVLGDAALLLYMFYLEMASIRKQVIITDDVIIEEFPRWSKSKAKKTRLLLINAGWIRTCRTTMHNKMQQVNYFLGQEEVTRSFAFEDHSEKFQEK